MKIDTEGRVELFRARIGSWNYNLQDETSDEDWKVFVLPTFEDLYCGTMYSSKSNTSVDLDYSAKDIRLFSGQVYKANLTFLELLYSDMIIINPKLNTETRDLVLKIFDMRDRLVRVNLPKMYEACVGMYNQRMKRLSKGTVNTQHLVEKYGYCTKSVMNAYRYVDFLYRFMKKNDFEKAMRYTNTESREKLLAFKKGHMGCDVDVQNILSMCFRTMEKECQNKYKNEQVDNETINELNSIVEDVIKINI